MYTQMLQVHASVWPSETGPSQEYQQEECRQVAPALPEDPRCWSRNEVLAWLWEIQRQHNLPPISADRFHMNGKALCLMNIDMFMQRVPLGGKLLYKDFQMRLTRALYSSNNVPSQNMS